LTDRHANCFGHFRNTFTEEDVKLVNPQGFGNLNTEQKQKWDSHYNKVKQDFVDRGFNFNDKTDDDLVRWKYKRYLQDYLATAASMDDNIGRVLKYLDDNRLRENTVVIYTSDQGFFMGEHGWFDKRFMYEESFRTPLIVRWPGVVQAGSVNNRDIVSNLDFAETFLEIAGANIPSDMQGASFVPILKGNTPAEWRKSFYYQYFEGPPAVHKVYRHYGVTTGRYKLIYFHDVDEWEFYDLKKDSHEMINQYYIAQNDSIIEVLKSELNKLRDDLKVDPDPNPANLKTIDIQKWTEPLEVQIFKASLLKEMKLTYNITGQLIAFDFSNSEDKPQSLSVHKPNGRHLENLELQGNSIYTWGIQNVNPGIYILEIQSKKQRYFLKFKR